METGDQKHPPLTFGQRLRKEREKRHISQEKLASMVGCDVRSIRRWEQGKATPDYANRHALSQALAINLETIDQFLRSSPEATSITVPDTEYLQTEGNISTTRLNLPDPTANTLPKPTEHSATNRRTLLTRWGTALIALGALGIAGGSAAYWFTHPASPLLYTYYAPAKTAVLDIEWSPKGGYLACVLDNMTTQIITDLAGMYHPSTLRSTLNCIAWSPDGTQLASPQPDGTLYVWDPVNGVGSFHIQDNTQKPEYPECVAWSHDGQRIALGGTDGSVRIWNAKTGALLLTYEEHNHDHTKTVWWVSWSPDDTHLASAGADTTVRIWNSTTNETLRIYTGHTRAVMDAEWSHSGDRIVSVSEDATAHIWDTRTGKTLLVYRGHKDSVQAAEWSPDGRSIASTGVDTTIQIWDALTGAHTSTYMGHTNTVWTLSWSPDGTRIASASQDGSMRIWQISG